MVLFALLVTSEVSHGQEEAKQADSDVLNAELKDRDDHQHYTGDRGHIVSKPENTTIRLVLGPYSKNIRLGVETIN